MRNEEGQYAESGPSSGASEPVATEGDAAAGVPTKAVPESHPKDDRPGSEEPLLVPPAEVPYSKDDDGSGSISPAGSLFESSNGPRVSDPPKAPAPVEQRQYTGQPPTPPSRPDSSAPVERGDLPRLGDLRVVAR